MQRYAATVPDARAPRPPAPSATGGAGGSPDAPDGAAERPSGAGPAGPGAEIVLEGGAAYRRDGDGIWRRHLDGAAVPGSRDLTLAELFDPPVQDHDGTAVRLVPRAWASRRPDHPLAWAFEHADLGGRGPIPVPAAEWDRRADQVVAMSAPALHPWNLVGTDGVAALLGVAEATVRAYLARDQMPAPIVRLGRTPVWSREQIEAWQATRSRARPPTFTARPAPGPDREGDPEDRDGEDGGSR